MGFIPSRASDLYAPFEHTWLKHRLLAQIEQNSDTWTSTANDVPSVLKAIPLRVQQLRLLLVKIAEALSPADLIDRSPISALPIDARAKIRTAVNSAFVESQIVQPLIGRIEDRMNNLEAISHQIVNSWADRQSRAVLLKQVSVAGEELRAALLALPSGIIFP